MTDTDAARNFRTNRFLLLQILLLDLIGFSLIFPVVPDLLEFYLAGARAGGIDAWLLPVVEFLRSLLPPERRDEFIVLAGGLLSSLYALINFIVAPYWGRLSDRIGRRPVLLLTSLGLALSYLFWFFSSSFTLFLVSRVIGGIMSGNLGVASAAMADMSSREHRTRDMGMLGAAFGVGFILGPVVGGISSQVDLTAYSDFDFLHPFSFCALVACVLSSLSAVRNFSSFSETHTPGTSAREWVSNPLRYMAGMRGTGMNRVLFINFLYLLMFSGWEFTFTFFYKFDFGLSPYAIGFIFLYVGVLVAAGQGGLVRRLAPRIPEKTMVLIGLLAMPLPLFLFGLTAPSVALSLAALAPIALASSLIAPSLSGMVSLLNSDEHQGLALGIFRSAGSLARALGPIVGAFLYWTIDVTWTYLVFALFILGAAGVAFTLKHVSRAEARD